MKHFTLTLKINRYQRRIKKHITSTTTSVLEAKQTFGVQNIDI